jgi:hypothetical protein
MSSDLPEAVAGYLAAEAAKDADAQSRWFSEQALVHDEGRDYRGRDQIQNWKREAHAKYNYTLEALGGSVSGDVVTVPVRLTGNFPGSPVELDYTFTLENGEITSLNIG